MIQRSLDRGAVVGIVAESFALFVGSLDDNCNTCDSKGDIDNIYGTHIITFYDHYSHSSQQQQRVNGIRYPRFPADQHERGSDVCGE